MNCNGNEGCCSVCWTEWIYSVFRVLVGGLFLWHGVGKLLNWSALPNAWLQTAGVLETIVGALILLGLFTRFAAAVGAVVMIGAWWKVHLAQGWNPMANGGELALLYFATFLALSVLGSGRIGLDTLFCKGCDCCCESGSCEMESKPAQAAPVKKAAKAKKKR